MAGLSHRHCRPPLHSQPDNRRMFLKAGLVSLLLLLASRVLGLVRESAMAAAFGASGMGDLAVLMVTLPDWLTGVLASGALAYVLLPQWAKQTPAQQAALQARVARSVVALGLVSGLAMVVWREPLLVWLAPGVNFQSLPGASEAMAWVAVAIPAALVAALWATRLQHERDFIGLYGANLVVNAGLIGLMVAMAWWGGKLEAWWSGVGQLGSGLCVVMVLRLLWLAWRTHRCSGCSAAPPIPIQVADDRADAKSWPAASVWVWAAACAGLPLALPFLVRSLASGAGEGALSTFNYAWKMVELPLMLAIQLVATLAFPALTRAMAAGDEAATQRLIRQAFALAWTLACAAALALQVGAPAIAALLFGWGRMDAEALATVAQWGSVGSWGLLPQALTAVAVTVLAAQGRLKVIALIHGVAVAVLWGIAPASGDGEVLMLCLNLVMTGIALCLCAALWLGQRSSTPLPWAGLVVPLLVLAGGAQLWAMLKSMVCGQFDSCNTLLSIVLSALFASFLIAISCFASADLRRALRR